MNENEKVIEFASNANDENLIDPMLIEDSAEDLKKKKEEWMKMCEEIFDLHPDFADFLFNMYKQNGGGSLTAMANDLYNYAIIRAIVVEGESVLLDIFKNNAQ